MRGLDPRAPQPTREALRLGTTAARLKLKGIDGGPHKRWSMLLNSRQREEPYPGLTWIENPPERAGSLRGLSTDAAWLSSARAVRCSVKSAQPVPPVTIGQSRGLWRDRPCQAGGRRGRRQVRMAPTPGAANVLQWPVQWDARPRGRADPPKPAPVRTAVCNSTARSRNR